jgi:hypothetical protein
MDSTEEVQRPAVIPATHDLASLLEIFNYSCVQAFSDALQLSQVALGTACCDS